jgi:hypothetical protein
MFMNRFNTTTIYLYGFGQYQLATLYICKKVIRHEEHHVKS